MFSAIKQNEEAGFDVSVQANLTPLLQNISAENAVARSSRALEGPCPQAFDFTCSATTGKAKNLPVLASKARLERFASKSFATMGLNTTKILVKTGQASCQKRLRTFPKTTRLTRDRPEMFRFFHRLPFCQRLHDNYKW